ncbi:c-type cytochrome [Salinarimonas rosea]|uniref:c-type cytochrome n=1 Tax=Salinarimonas rosea TaxID=552063 RepID=UPI000429BB07|nr:cytochrome c [Salinarimonas rosea]
MRSRFRALALPALASALVALAASGPASAQDAADGRAIAERWCASCHLVSPDQETAMDGVASFREVAARGPLAVSALEAFLADPHPLMPDMALTREEIADLVAYIDSLAN